MEPMERNFPPIAPLKWMVGICYLHHTVFFFVAFHSN